MHLAWFPTIPFYRKKNEALIFTQDHKANKYSRVKIKYKLSSTFFFFLNNITSTLKVNQPG